MSRHFVYVLFPSANKSQLSLSMKQDLSKTFYNDQKESVSIANKFSLTILFFDSSIFTDRKDLTIE